MRHLPDGISLQVMNEMHNISQIRKLLVRAFVLNNEPVIQVLGERHYPTLSPVQRLVQIERKFKSLYPDQSLIHKIKDGMSLVAVKDRDPTEYLSIVFAETYKGVIYQNISSTRDTFCQEALNLMHAVHEKAVLFLSDYPPEKIAFLSHAATAPEYRSRGIMEANADFAMSLLVSKGFKLAYSVTTAERLTRFLNRRFNFHVIAEVTYQDYQNKGQVFANLASREKSAKALVKFL